MHFLIFIVSLCSLKYIQSLHLNPPGAVYNAVQGSRVQVNCSAQNSVDWKNIEVGTVTGNNNSVGAVTSAISNFQVLTIENVQKADEGSFTCEDASNDKVSFELKVFEVKTSDALFNFKEDTVLGCLVLDDNKTFTYSWERYGKPVSNVKMEGKEAFIEYKNGSLEIKHPSRKLAGMYHCIAEYDSGGNANSLIIDVYYYAHPYVIPFEKSKNLVQDEKLVIECKVLGHPKPVISWSKDGIAIQAVEGSRYKLSPAESYNGKMIDNAKLTLRSVDFDDAGNYYCFASQEMWPDVNSTQVLLVRVKDKLAALWPFLGIVAEVIILCTIIFIYEKRRGKGSPSDDDMADQGVTADKKPDVRHRSSAKNPKA